MRSRIAGLLAGAVLFSAGVAHASPDPLQPASPTLENRARLVAARMAQGESYDQATRGVPLTPDDEFSRAIAREMSKGSTYRDARVRMCERPEVINARWNKHQVAMQNGGSHEAGWAASIVR